MSAAMCAPLNKVVHVLLGVWSVINRFPWAQFSRTWYSEITQLSINIYYSLEHNFRIYYCKSNQIPTANIKVHLYD